MLERNNTITVAVFDAVGRYIAVVERPCYSTGPHFGLCKFAGLAALRFYCCCVADMVWMNGDDCVT